MKQDSTDIILILDRSASMASIAEGAREGFNGFLAEQKALPGRCQLTLVQFATKRDPDVYKDIQEVEALTEETYNPTGMSTALYDSVCTTINDVGARLRAMAEDDRPAKILVVILTDGLNNDSREFTLEQMREMVEHQEEHYQWGFLFLGANMDAIEEAGKLGIQAHSALPYAPTSKGIMCAMGSVSRSATQYRCAATQEARDEALTFKDDEREEQEAEGLNIPQP